MTRSSATLAAIALALALAAPAGAKTVRYEAEVPGLTPNVPGVITLNVEFKRGEPTELYYNFRDVRAQCPGTAFGGTGGAGTEVKVNAQGRFRAKSDNGQPPGNRIAHKLTGKVSGNGKKVKGDLEATVPFGGVQCDADVSYTAQR